MGLRGETEAKKKQKHMVLPAGGGKGEWDSQTSGRQLPLLCSARPHRQDPPRAGITSSKPTQLGPAVDSAAETGRNLQVQDRRRTAGLSLLGSLSWALPPHFFSPTKKVMKGQEGRPPKHCVRLDGQMLLERWRRLKGNPPEFSAPAGRCPSCWGVRVAGMGGRVARKASAASRRLQHNGGG